MIKKDQLELALATARRAVTVAAEIGLRHFNTDVEVCLKPDQSPVTIADKACDEAIVSVIREQFRDDTILTEESGVLGRGGPRRWIVDPIDGTRSFIRGGLFWGPLVALEVDGKVVVGAMALPTLGQTFWAAKGMGCFRDGNRLHVSSVDRLDEAVLSLGELDNLLKPPFGAGVNELIDTAVSSRCYGDLGTVGLVLQGKADVSMECAIAPWDVAPYQILLKEAGGCFTDFCGDDTIESGSALGSNGHLHEHVLKVLREAAENGG